MSNYKQNKNNGWENLTGELVHIKWSSPDVHIIPINIYMNKTCKCGEELHPVRIKYGYNTCVPCSTVERYGCAPVINHKTGNSIQILSRADAERIAKLTRRKGYGTMLR